MTLAALESVLQLYANPQRLKDELPIMRALTRPVAELEALAARLLPRIVAVLSGKANAMVIQCASQIGSGSLPVESLPSAGIAIAIPGKNKTSAVQIIAKAFRALPVPVIGRIKDGAFLMDLRCLDDEHAFVAQLGNLDLGQ